EMRVRMARRRHLQIIPESECQPYSPSLQLIHNGAVINPVNRHTLAALIMKQAAALFLDVGDAYRSDAEHLLRHQEIRQGFLMQWIDLHQNDIFAILASCSRLPQKVQI